MGITNLGRVQGGGMFYSTAASGTSINKNTLTPTNITPLVGDSILFENGDIRQIIAVTSSTITCGSVTTSLKGKQGDQGPEGAVGSGNNPNLLLNSDFKINQRGQASYVGSNAYTVDCWGTVHSLTSVQIIDKGVRVLLSQQYAKFRQIIKDVSGLKGKTITMSAKISNLNDLRNNLYFQIAQTISDETDESIRVKVSNNGIISVSGTIRNDISGLSVDFYTWSNSTETTSFDIEWVKLEIGSNVTLFSPKSYEEELAACQVIDGGLSTTYVNPNMVINGDFRVNQRNKSIYSNSAYYTADGWQLGKNNDGSFDVSTKTLSCGTTGTYAILTHYVNVDIVALKGKQLTLSADIKGDGVNTVYLQFGYFTGTNFTQIAVNIIRNAPATMNRYVITGIIPDNVTSANALAVRPYINAGSCVIDNIKLELGAVATPYNQRPYSEELAMCQMPSVSGNQNLSTTYSNENILINGDFRVNQRNFTSTTDIGFTVDRWKNTRENTAVSLNDDGTITLSSTPTQNNNTLITQKLEEKDYKNLLGGAITISAMVSLDEGQTYSVYALTAVLPQTLPTTVINNEIYFTDDAGVRHGSVRQYWTGSQFAIDVFGYNGYNVRVKWVKLEKGEIATPYNPRPYAEELSMCQRYYQKLRINDTQYCANESAMYPNIKLIQTLRTRPTISVITYPSIRGNGSNLGVIDNLTSAELKDDMLLCSTNAKSLGVVLGKLYMITNGVITADAEIY